MKGALFAALLPALVSAAVVASSQKVSYDGFRVLRVKTSPEVIHLIKSYSLQTWSGEPEKTEYADVLVPPGSAALFSGIANEVMHEDLGDSIAKEAEFQPLAGMVF